MSSPRSIANRCGCQRVCVLIYVTSEFVRLGKKASKFSLSSCWSRLFKNNMPLLFVTLNIASFYFLKIDKRFRGFSCVNSSNIEGLNSSLSWLIPDSCHFIALLKYVFDTHKIKHAGTVDGLALRLLFKLTNSLRRFQLGKTSFFQFLFSKHLSKNVLSGILQTKP